MKETKRLNEWKAWQPAYAGIIQPSGNCQRKRRFDSKAAAEREAGKAARHYVERLRAYRCKRCKSWHMTGVMS